jgi:hypothetical protein
VTNWTTPGDGATLAELRGIATGHFWAAVRIEALIGQYGEEARTNLQMEIGEVADYDVEHVERGVLEVVPAQRRG